jgi:hypothetical protein
MTTKRRTKINKGLAVGSAMVLGASSGGEGAQGKPQLKTAEMIAIPDFALARSVIDRIAADVRHVSVNVPPEPGKWTKSDARRFSELATKRALKQATRADEREFLSLREQRRVNNLGSPDDVLTEWRRRRFTSDLLNLLRRNVRLLKAEDQARLRSLGQT